MFILIFLSVVLWANDILQIVLNSDFYIIGELMKLISIDTTFLFTINFYFKHKKDK